MSSSAGTSTAWAIIAIIVIPAAIIAASELDERLRQRQTVLRRVVGTLRLWALPFFAIWALLVPVLGGDRESLSVRIVASGLVLSILSIQFLSTGLNMLMLELSGSSAAIFFRQFAWGALLLLVMVLNYYAEKRRNRVQRAES